MTETIFSYGYINQLAIGSNVTTGYYRAEYVRVFPIGHK